jgi:hypothetical protein
LLTIGTSFSITVATDTAGGPIVGSAFFSQPASISPAAASSKPAPQEKNRRGEIWEFVMIGVSSGGPLSFFVFTCRDNT